MTNPTSNFGWQMPTSTDLVTDLPADFEVFGQAVDTALVDLKGGTTGQVLSKTTDADMDFTWVAQDDSNAIQNAIVDAKGDLIAASANDTPARLAVGTNGQLLSADSTAATGLAWVAAPESGGMTVVASGSLSGSTTVISSIPGTYNNLRLLIRNPRGASDNRELYIRLNGDTGTNYNYSLARENFNVAANSSFLPVGFNMDNSVNNGTLFMDFSDYANTSVWKLAKSFSAFTNATNNSNSTYADYLHFWKSTSAITSITMYVDSGDWAGGTYVLYGVK